MFAPVLNLNISPSRCPPEPVPWEAKLKPPGFALASATRSAADFTGLSDGTASNWGKAPHQRDRPEILDRVVGQRRIQRCVGRVGAGIRLEQSMAIGRRLLDHRRGDDAAAARTRLDDERLTSVLGDLLVDDALQRVGACPWRERNNDSDRSRRQKLRASLLPRGYSHGKDRGQDDGC